MRYDAKEKRVPWIAEVLAKRVEIVSICPEVGAGMPVPRPPIQIVRGPGEEGRIVVVGEGSDQTELMKNFIGKQLLVLQAQPIDGYIFKARSPSCGLRDTPYFESAAKADSASAHGAGLWAAAVVAKLPTLPCVDESDVTDPEGQERFLARVQAHWQARS